MKLLQELKSNSPKDLKIVNFKVKYAKLERYYPVNPAALQTVNKKINETESEMERLKGLAPLVNIGMHFSTIPKWTWRKWTGWVCWTKNDSKRINFCYQPVVNSVCFAINTIP